MYYVSKSLVVFSFVYVKIRTKQNAIELNLQISVGTGGKFTCNNNLHDTKRIVSVQTTHVWNRMRS